MKNEVSGFRAQGFWGVFFEGRRRVGWFGVVLGGWEEGERRGGEGRRGVGGGGKRGVGGERRSEGRRGEGGVGGFGFFLSFLFTETTLERVSAEKQHNMWTRTVHVHRANHLRGGRGGSIRTQDSWASKEANSHNFGGTASQYDSPI